MHTISFSNRTLIAGTLVAMATIATSCSKENEYDAQGTFEATEITVSAEGTGKILSLDIEEGDSVRAGQVIGQIDTLQLHLQKLELRQQYAAALSARPDIATQQLALREQIAGAQTERDRIKRLLADGAATQQQLDNANTRLASLQGELAALQSNLTTNTRSIDEKAKAILETIATINDRIANCTVTAPISGIVVSKIAEPGEVTAFGAPLCKVSDLGNMYLRAYFTSDQLADLYVGRKVKVMAVYGGDTQREYDGTISYISPTSEFTPKTIQTKNSRANLVYAVKIAVNNDGRLKTGLTGEVYLGNDNDNKKDNDDNRK